MNKLRILTPEDISFFKRNGYLVIRNVYRIEDINAMRDIFDGFFKEKIWREKPWDSEYIINDIYLHKSELAEYVFNEAYFNIVRDLLGEKIIFLPECAVHRNRYIDWHRDTTSAEKEGHTFHKETDECLLQCALYFQDNGINGGGLSIIPGSQLNTDRFITFYRPNFIQRFYHKIMKHLGKSVLQQIEKNETIVDIDTKKGDLLVFDLQVDHRSTYSKTISAEKKDKYAVFNTFGSINSSAIQYQDYLKSRPEPYYRHISQQTAAPTVLQKKAEQFDIEIYY